MHLVSKRHPTRDLFELENQICRQERLVSRLMMQGKPVSIEEAELQAKVRALQLARAARPQQSRQ
jgi:hypothetical protein